jgi:phospholipid/cholesterol/gamma-HCH transport system substrate-binding protein
MRAKTVRTRARNHAIRSVALGLAGVAAALTLGWIGFTAEQRIPWRSYRVIHAQVRDLGNLPPLGAEVRIAGRRVGQVLNPRLLGGIPTVDLQLDGGTEQLHPDASLMIRPRGLLGVQYVDLNPGTAPGRMRDGATIPASRASVSVDLPRALSALDAPRRADLRTTLSALGEGMLGRGPQINEALSVAPGVLGNTAALSTAILARRGAAQRFFGSIEAAAAAADPVRQAIASGWQPEQQALQPLARRADALRQTLTEAPPALSALHNGLAASDPLLAQTTAFAEATTRLTRLAPSALAQATKLLTQGRAPLRNAQTLLAQASSAVPPLLRFTSRIDPELPPLEAGLAGNLPLLRALDPRGCDILGYWSNWRSMLSYAAGGSGPLGPLVVLRYELLGSGETVASGSSTPGPVGRDPYPAPCQAGNEELP